MIAFFLSGHTVGLSLAATEIQYWTNHTAADPGKYFSHTLEPPTEKFMQEHPNIKIKFVEISHQYFQDKVNTALATGKGPDMWDAEIGWTYDYYNRGILAEPPKEFVDLLKQSVLPAPLRTLTVKGKVVGGIPPYTDCLALFYNKDHFVEAGLGTPPENWEELEEYALKLTKRGESGKLTQSGFSQWEAYEHVFWSFFFQNGGEFFDQDPIKMITSKEAIEAAQFAFKDPYQVWNVAALDFYEGYQGFTAGKVSMYVDGNWRLFTFDTKFPNLHYSAAELPKHKKRATTQGGWNVLINKKSSPEIWTYAKFLISDEVNKTRLEVNFLPATKTAYQNVDWSQYNPNLKFFYRSLDYARAMPFFEGFQKFKKTLNSKMEEIIGTDITVEEAFNYIAERMRRELVR